jgi:hypothetical protein
MLVRTLTLTISIFLASAFGGPAEAYFFTGNQLYRECTLTDKNQLLVMLAQQLCLSIIIGHYEMMVSLKYDCGDDAKKETGQIKDVVVNYLKEHPAERSLPAVRISSRAIIEAFHCVPRDNN